MTPRITQEQRRRVLALLDAGLTSQAIAQEVGLSAGQVSAVAAHRTMGHYGRVPPTKPVSATGNSGSPAAGRTDATTGARRTSQTGLVAEEPPALQSPGTAASEVELGTDLETGRQITWRPRQATNPHVLILGQSGFGKTYTVSQLISDLAEAHVPSVVFDYGQGFTAGSNQSAFRGLRTTRTFQLNTRGIGINPLTIFAVDTHGPVTVAQRVADTFARVFPRLGIQQHATLRNAVLEVFEDAGVTPDDPASWALPPPPFREVNSKLTQYGLSTSASTRRLATSTAAHISTLFFFDTFREAGDKVSWMEFLEQKRAVWILALGGLEASVERAVTEFLLWNLIRHMEVRGPAELSCFVVLDEAHKLVFGAGSPVEKILREGRKFGLGVILASQQPEDFSPVAFANTATKIIFQVGDESGNVAHQLRKKITGGHGLEQIDTISTLPRGSAYVVIENTGQLAKMRSSR